MSLGKSEGQKLAEESSRLKEAAKKENSRNLQSRPH
jgi:hypothetical protein